LVIPCSKRFSIFIDGPLRSSGIKEYNLGMNEESKEKDQKIEELTQRIVSFRDARDWKQFHNPKDMAISLELEASELLEHFQWKNPKEIEEYLKSNKNDVAEEVADVLYWVLLIANDLKIDLTKASLKKLEKNEAKYPIDKAKGRHTKYNKL